MNIAVTGGIGSGKSMVSSELSKLLSANLVNVDHICRNLLQPDCDGLKALQQVAPAICFLEDGSLNRPALREALFTDDIFRKQIDSLIHPMVHKEVIRLCMQAEKDNNNLVVDIPLLFETGWQGDFDFTLLVYANEQICTQRIMRRDSVSKKAALLSIAAQIPIQQKVKIADFLVDNSGLFSETLDQIEYLVTKGCFFKKTNVMMKNT